MTAKRTAARAQFSIERSYAAPVERVWELWTTRRGIESWWGPEGFEVRVTSLELRPGGVLSYAMTAVAPEQVAFMKQAGMPLTTHARVIYTEITPGKRLAYKTVADFIPGVEPYDVGTVVEFQATATGVKLVISVDAMHDEVWTERARAGNEGQLRKLDTLLGTH